MNARTCAEPRGRGGWRALAACVLLALPAGVFASDAYAAGASDAAGVRTIVLGATLSDRNPFVPERRSSTFRATIFLAGERARVDFAGPSGERGVLLADGSTGKGWLASLDDGLAVPLDASAVRGFAALLIDPAAPCARIGRRCEPVPPRFIAGASREGYRFRSAMGKGPGGLSDGEFWIESDLGLVLAYRGRGPSAKDAPAMDAAFVLVDDVDAAYFELPDSVSAHDLPLTRASRGSGVRPIR